ncbi:hypothetical protein [Rhodanobacter sp. PCA2]|uniref:virion core protein, T7 gp14 family n=1 Tax=Rhodanobacter sp. PCA2 TaxID=2006117 RepID=UPI0015E7A195|nr:hypothetical protein [Rhodanobacter sp. PCA2]MBA2077049.1 hypothetical protein [Rhodanobacter sp. PCA2]
MCEPTTITLAATSVLSAAMAVRNANQQKHAVEAQAKRQQDQINQQASAQVQDRMTAARQARASARAAAAESGVSGNSVAAQLNDFMQQAGTDVARIEKNRQNGNAETSIAAKSRFAEINGQLTSSLIGAAETGGKAYMGHRVAVDEWAAANPVPVGPSLRSELMKKYGISG